jgi:hypothetical protein
LIPLIIFAEAYKLWSSSSCSLLQPPAITSRLLNPNILSVLSLCFSLVWLRLMCALSLFCSSQVFGFIFLYCFLLPQEAAPFFSPTELWEI